MWILVSISFRNVTRMTMQSVFMMIPSHKLNSVRIFQYSDISYGHSVRVSGNPVTITSDSNCNFRSSVPYDLVWVGSL